MGMPRGSLVNLPGPVPAPAGDDSVAPARPRPPPLGGARARPPKAPALTPTATRLPSRSVEVDSAAPRAEASSARGDRLASTRATEGPGTRQPPQAGAREARGSRGAANAALSPAEGRGGRPQVASAEASTASRKEGGRYLGLLTTEAARATGSPARGDSPALEPATRRKGRKGLGELRSPSSKSDSRASKAARRTLDPPGEPSSSVSGSARSTTPQNPTSGEGIESGGSVGRPPSPVGEAAPTASTSAGHLPSSPSSTQSPPSPSTWPSDSGALAESGSGSESAVPDLQGRTSAPDRPPGDREALATSPLVNVPASGSTSSPSPSSHPLTGKGELRAKGTEEDPFILGSSSEEGGTWSDETRSGSEGSLDGLGAGSPSAVALVSPTRASSSGGRRGVASRRSQRRRAAAARLEAAGLPQGGRRIEQMLTALARWGNAELERTLPRRPDEGEQSDHGGPSGEEDTGDRTRTAGDGDLEGDAELVQPASTTRTPDATPSWARDDSGSLAAVAARGAPGPIPPRGPEPRGPGSPERARSPPTCATQGSVELCRVEGTPNSAARKSLPPRKRPVEAHAVYPPGNASGGVYVSTSDVKHLAPGEFLNDTNLDLFLRMLQDRLDAREVAERAEVTEFRSAQATSRAPRGPGPASSADGDAATAVVGRPRPRVRFLNSFTFRRFREGRAGDISPSKFDEQADRGQPLAGEAACPTEGTGKGLGAVEDGWGDRGGVAANTPKADSGIEVDAEAKPAEEAEANGETGHAEAERGEGEVGATEGVATDPGHPEVTTAGASAEPAPVAARPPTPSLAASPEAAAPVTDAKRPRRRPSLDIFSYDYLLLPVNDDLHWSLIIICHPGVAPPSHRDRKKGLHNEIWRVAPRTPCILHLDSIPGGHHSLATTQHVRAFLVHEWELRRRALLAESAAAGRTGHDGTGASGPEQLAPRRGARADHAGPPPASSPYPHGTRALSPAAPLDSRARSPVVPPSTRARSQAAQPAPGAAAPSCGPPPADPPRSAEERKAATTSDLADPLLPRSFDISVFPHKRVRSPSQDNEHDCGLFVLTTAEFFAEYAPPAINVETVSALSTQRVAAKQRGMRVSGRDWYPGFLTEFWYTPANAGALRDKLMHDILILFAVQAGAARYRPGVRPYDSDLDSEKSLVWAGDDAAATAAGGDNGSDGSEGGFRVGGEPPCPPARSRLGLAPTPRPPRDRLEAVFELRKELIRLRETRHVGHPLYLGPREYLLTVKRRLAEPSREPSRADKRRARPRRGARIFQGGRAGDEPRAIQAVPSRRDGGMGEGSRTVAPSPNEERFEARPEPSRWSQDGVVFVGSPEPAAGGVSPVRIEDDAPLSAGDVPGPVRIEHAPANARPGERPRRPPKAWDEGTAPSKKQCRLIGGPGATIPRPGSDEITFKRRCKRLDGLGDGPEASPP